MAESHPELKDMIDLHGFETTEARQAIIDYIEVTQIIDSITTGSSYKNIYKPPKGEGYEKKTPEEKKAIEDEYYKALDKAGIEYTRPQDGDIISFPPEKIGLKAIDFSRTPEITAEETLTLSTQFQRALFNISDVDPIGNQKHIDAITKYLNDIKIDNLKDFNKLVAKIGEDPTGVIDEIAQRFGVTFDDHELQQYISSRNVEHVFNMLSNVAQKNILSALTLKGNSMRMRSIPDYDNVNAAVNKALVEKFGE